MGFSTVTLLKTELNTSQVLLWLLMKSYEENILTFLSILLFRKRYLTGYWNHQVPLFHSKPDKSSRSQMFFKIGVGKHLCWSLFLTNLHVFRPQNNYFYRTTPVTASVRSSIGFQIYIFIGQFQTSFRLTSILAIFAKMKFSFTRIGFILG